MSIEKTNFDEITDSDINQLVEDSISEGIRIEFKRELYKPGDSQKKELLKDVSAFANSHGGHLILGVEEENGVAVSVPGLSDIDPDEETQKLEHSIQSGIEPRIPGIRIRTIPVDDNKYVIVVRIPRSWNPPHRTDYKGSRKFWIRNSSGAHEASMDELRNIFTLSSDTIEKIRAFRLERIKIIQEGSGIRPLEGNGRLILHIVPLSAFSSAEQIDLKAAHASHHVFEPIGASSHSPGVNFDGFINERGGENNYGYTQVFRNGIIEATTANLISERNGVCFIPGMGIEQKLFQAVPGYLDGLKQIDVAPPLVIMVTFEGVNEVTYGIYRSSIEGTNPKLDRPVFLLPECILDEYGDTLAYHRCIKPAFDALWNSFGYFSAPYFNEDGLWIGPNQ